MKDKAKSDCEGFEGQAQTIANPRKMVVEDPAYIDWLDVGRFDPFFVRFKGEVPRSVETRHVSFGLAMAEASRRRSEQSEAARRDVLRRSETFKQGNALTNLFARGTLDERRLRAALQLREEWRLSTGGVSASDWMREKVDGGRLFLGMSGGLNSALDADRKVREWLTGSGMGVTAAEVVLRVAAQDEALITVAIDFEDTPELLAKAKRDMKPSRQAQDHVRRLLRDGLAALADHLYGAEGGSQRLLANALKNWLTLDLRGAGKRMRNGRHIPSND